MQWAATTRYRVLKKLALSGVRDCLQAIMRSEFLVDVV